MRADFYIPTLSNDMKLVVRKNHLWVKFFTEVWTVQKRRQSRNTIGCSILKTFFWVNEYGKYWIPGN